MSTLIFLAGIFALICLPVCGAIFIFRRQHEHQVMDYAKRREEEKNHQWLENIGLRETSFFFNVYGIRLLSIWGIRITATGSWNI
ncbi:hypothetical protein LCGC14_1618930 [marine sediment metagenome]|uniref:Uncharacterized protein n=1 Tax=marine sediment metagenome TaxID=412755 RepID=A0A0F9I637_9ZZZZ